MKANLVIAAAAVVGALAFVCCLAFVPVEELGLDLSEEEVQYFRESLKLELELLPPDKDRRLLVVLRVTNLTDDTRMWYNAKKTAQRSGYVWFDDTEHFRYWEYVEFPSGWNYGRGGTIEMIRELSSIRQSYAGSKTFRSKVKNGKVRMFVFLD